MKQNKNKSESHNGCESDEPDGNTSTSNVWEKADLGDEERKNKFMKLMGNSKDKKTNKEELDKEESLKSENTQNKKDKKTSKEDEDKDESLKTENTLNKRKHEELTSVHSANAWEGVDLGDDDRKNKFLKLMGAAKTEHKGKIVIGEKSMPHPRTKEETEQVEDALEGQYKHSIEMKLSAFGRRRHLGLGFHNDEDDVPDHSEADKTEEPDSSEVLKEDSLDHKLTSAVADPHNLKFGHFVKSNRE